MDHCHRWQSVALKGAELTGRVTARELHLEKEQGDSDLMKIGQKIPLQLEGRALIVQTEMVRGRPGIGGSRIV